MSDMVKLYNKAVEGSTKYQDLLKKETEEVLGIKITLPFFSATQNIIWLEKMLAKNGELMLEKKLWKKHGKQLMESYYKFHDKHLTLVEEILKNG